MLIGAHCSGGVKRALDRAVEIGSTEAVQLFTQSPRTWRHPAPDPEVHEAFREHRRELGIGAVLCHALYLCNLAAPDDTIYEKSVTALSATVDAACAIEAEGVVFHVGSHLGAGFDAGADRVEAAMRKVLERCSDTTWLLMENSAGAGGTIGRSIDELAALFDRLDGHERLGICLDSCHWYVSGCDVTDRATLDDALQEVDSKIGLDRLRALHINDAKSPLGSNSDRHDNVLDGLMGEQLGVFVGHPDLQGLPAVLEVPGTDGHGPDAEQIGRLKELHGRWATM
jgi:deoxyribonuclease-4